MNDPEQPPNDASPPNDAPRPKPLSAREAAELAGRVAELSQAGLPLGPGLRAAAAELPRGRLAAALERLAAGIERGQTLDQAMAAERRALPRTLQALVAAGVRTGNLGGVLEEFVHFKQTNDDVRRSVWLAAIYPAFLLGMLAILLVYAFGYLLPTIVGAVARQPDEFYTGDYAGLAEWQGRFAVFHWLAVHMAVIGAVAILILAAIGLAILSGRPFARRLMHQLPLVGMLGWQGALAEFSHLMRILISHGTPLPEALRLTAESLGDADVAAGCRQLAARVEAGMPLAVALDGLPQFIPILRPILGWGEQHAALPTALDAAARSCVAQLRLRAELLREIAPQIVLIGVAALILSMVELLRAGLGMLSMVTGSSGSATTPPGPNMVNAAALIFLGAVVLVALRLVYRGRKQPADALQELLRMTGRLLIALGLLGGFVAFDMIWGIVLWMAAMTCWGIGVDRLRRSQQRALLELLALAAERGIPLEPLARAWAAEQGGVFFNRVGRLADSLAAGMPFSEAVRGSPRALPPRTELAARIGEVNGALGAALRELGAGRGRLIWLWEGLPLRLIGLVLVAGILFRYFYSVAVKAWPALFVIFQDFHERLPPLTRWVMGIVASPITAVVCWLVFPAIVIVLIYSLLRGLGWIQFDAPLLARLAAPLDTAVVLRWLSLVAERGRPLEPAAEFLADRYPRRLIRKRLRRVVADLARGRDWADSLRGAKLIRQTDQAILRAAGRVGNLAWALSEAAANGERRLNYRLQALTQFLLPLVILAVGGAVMIFVIAWFLPVIALIRSLAG